MGRTKVAAKTVNPKWDEATSTFTITYDAVKGIYDNVLEIEVIDTHVQKHKPDFMGCVKFTADELYSLFTSKGPKTFPLTKSDKWDKDGNKLVHGKIQLQGISAEEVVRGKGPTTEVEDEEEHEEEPEEKKEEVEPEPVIALAAVTKVGGWMAKSLFASASAAVATVSKVVRKEEVEDANADDAASGSGSLQRGADSRLDASDHGSVGKNSAAGSRVSGSVRDLDEASVGSLETDDEFGMRASLGSISVSEMENEGILNLTIVKLERLPRGLLVVKFNGVPMHSMSVESCENSTKVACKYFEIPIPYMLETSSCSLQVELWDESHSYFWGEVDIRGSALAQLADCRDVELAWFNFDQSCVPRLPNSPPLARRIVSGRIQVGAIVLRKRNNASNKVYDVDILSVCNVPEVSQFNHRFVVVFYVLKMHYHTVLEIFALKLHSTTLFWV